MTKLNHLRHQVWSDPFSGSPLFVAEGFNPRRLMLMLILLVLLVAVPALAQTEDRYAGLPQSQSLQGFPQVGYPSALVDVRIYAAFDDPASAQFWADTSDALIQRVRNGEIRLVFVPLYGTGEVAGGRGAARASVCAITQNIFWQYIDQLMAWQNEFGADAFSGERLLSGALALGANQGQWADCFASDNPDLILDDAIQATNNEVSFSRTPYVVVGGSPSLTDADSLNFTIDLVLREANDELATQTSAEMATPEATSELDRYTFDPLAHENVQPPLTITLPEGWTSGYDALVLQDIDGIRPIPFAVFNGPVTGGMGTIVLLWGFPNLIIGAAPGGVIPPPDVWTDGTRLLRLAVVGEGCNVGTDLRRNYSIGGMQAVGTQFAAVGCPDLPDTRGWFAGLRQFNINFVFYAYTEPITAMDGSAPDELQTILDTVQFIMPEATPEATAAS